MTDMMSIQFIQQTIKRLEEEKEFLPMLQKMLEAAIEILGADKGSLQLYDEENNLLRIVAQVGFNQQFMEHFRTVTPGLACCGVALMRRQRVTIEDVTTDPEFAHLRPTFLTYGYVAVQSTPLMTDSGKILGMISTHFINRRQFTVSELSLLDLLIQQAMPLIREGVSR